MICCLVGTAQSCRLNHAAARVGDSLTFGRLVSIHASDKLVVLHLRMTVQLLPLNDFACMCFQQIQMVCMLLNKVVQCCKQVCNQL